MGLQRVGQLAGAHESGHRRRALDESAGVRVGRFSGLLGGDGAADFLDQFSNAHGPAPGRSYHFYHTHFVAIMKAEAPAHARSMRRFAKPPGASPSGASMAPASLLSGERRSNERTMLIAAFDRFNKEK